MLKPEDNERLTRVGPGTPAGELFRRYWLPALLSSEVPEPEGAPVRVRMLGEDLLGFRDTTGRVALVDAFCAHRRAPLFFGRNEEGGIRCVYHGWKFDAEGNCVEFPSEPAGTPLLGKVRIVAYPTVERGDVVWAYLGPRADQPEPPDYEWLRAPATHRHASKTFEDCNYLQGLEGGLDSTHSSFLHNNNLGDMGLLRNRDRSPRLEVEPTDYGYRYASIRNADNEQTYIRVYQYIMPTVQMRGTITAFGGGRNKVPKIDGHIWVPIDDEHTNVYNFMYSHDAEVPLTEAYVEQWESFSGRGKNDLIPGTFHLKSNPANDYLIDRKLQKTKTFTGITGINTQDFALQQGMGAIVDRSKENLGTSDRAIVTMRRQMLEATRTVEQGGRPPALDPSTYRGVRPHDDYVAAGQDWRTALTDAIRAKW